MTATAGDQLASADTPNMRAKTPTIRNAIDAQATKYMATTTTAITMNTIGLRKLTPANLITR